MKIRKAKPEDASKIANLRKKTFTEINGKDYPKRLIDALNKKDNNPKAILRKIKEREVFCLIDNKKGIIGVADLDIKKKKIGGVFVRYDLVRRGLGKKLLKFIEKRAKKKRIKKVILYSTKYAYPFYLKQGYKFVKKATHKVEGLLATAYQMEKRLR